MNAIVKLENPCKTDRNPQQSHTRNWLACKRMLHLMQKEGEFVIFKRYNIEMKLRGHICRLSSTRHAGTTTT